MEKKNKQNRWRKLDPSKTPIKVDDSFRLLGLGWTVHKVKGGYFYAHPFLMPAMENDMWEIKLATEAAYLLKGWTRYGKEE